LFFTYFRAMNCLLIAATAAEISPFINHYRETEKLVHIDFSLDVLVPGVGLMATTYALTRQLAIKKPDLVILAGIGGCFDKNIPLATVVSISQDMVADQCVAEPNGIKTLFELKLAKPNQFPYKNKWLVNPDKNLLKRSRLITVNGISVNEITTDKKKINFYRREFNPVIESMEGAALHYVCLMEKIPFLQIRSISNYIGERNKKKWKLKDAVTNLNKELIRLFENL
jgi:futalosine hydrolase